jgi:hypothetical protein
LLLLSIRPGGIVLVIVVFADGDILILVRLSGIQDLAEALDGGLCRNVTLSLSTTR